jgi:hypothetical protein
LTHWLCFELFEKAERRMRQYQTQLLWHVKYAQRDEIAEKPI